ncbi:MAG: hypothetical protein OK439_06755 [Thaumarchaeota archaeon]|nr:hypothetical protein [Nitrososphaerota archaeon]
MNREARKVYRQGDVLVRETEIDGSLKRELSSSEKQELVISGETGHNHSIRGHYRQSDGLTLLLLDEASQMTHPQHATLDLPSGLYEVYRTREFEESGQRFAFD